MSQWNRQPDGLEDEPQLPPRLAKVLADLHRPDVVVPSAVDRAILSAAKAGAARRRRARMVLRWAGVGTAAAAAVTLVAVNLNLRDGDERKASAVGYAMSKSDTSGVTADDSTTASRAVGGAAGDVAAGAEAEAPPVLPVLAADVDHNGRVDIVDALVLAKLIEAGDEAVAQWDLNGDGAVNDVDVDQVAAEAVSMET